jgi:hypothetical protein
MCRCDLIWAALIGHLSLLFLCLSATEKRYPPRRGYVVPNSREKFLPMKKNRRTKTENLLPTGACYPFYDPQQLEAKEPRKDSFEVVFEGTFQQRSDGAIKIERAWADVTTHELRCWIDLFAVEIFRRALAGEEDAVDTFAREVARSVRRLEDLTDRQRRKVKKVAVISPFWSVNVTRRDTDFAWAKRYVRGLKVGSKSLLRGTPRSMVRRHGNAGRLAETLWLQLLNNRDELPKLLEQADNKNARDFKTKWISRLLSLPTVEETVKRVTAQDALAWWELGEALLREAWQDEDRRQLTFGSMLPEYRGRRTRRKTLSQCSEAEIRDDIFKRLKTAFLSLLGHAALLRRKSEK